MKKTVALIFGGEGRERKISERSACNLSFLIDTKAYNLLLVGITDTGEWYIYDGEREKIENGKWFSDKEKLTATYPIKLKNLSGLFANDKIIPICCAIPCLHGDFGEDGIIQGALKAAHIKYIGQNTYASAITSDKSYAKLVAEYLQIPTAKWFVATLSSPREARLEAEARIGYPMFLKPTRLGSSFGAHPIYHSEEFESAYNDAYSYEGRVLIEELIPFSCELECAFLEKEGISLAPYGKISCNGKFYDYKSKYDTDSQAKAQVIKSDLIVRIEKLVLDYSKRLVNFLELKYLSRIDFFITESLEVYFNEINTFPGMTKSSLYPALTEEMGLERGCFINHLISTVCSNDRGI